jgi:GNAT superfamily N-acetyltransferase
MDLPDVVFMPADVGEGAALAQLRVAAMRESLERVTRFDPVRAQDRFLADYSPEHTCHIEAGGVRVGCVVVKPHALGLLLEHLYIHPDHQNQGLGSAVLAKVFALADAADQSIRVGVLRDSDANRFYLRHGFVLMEETEWDLYYARPCLSDQISDRLIANDSIPK